MALETTTENKGFKILFWVLVFSYLFFFSFLFFTSFSEKIDSWRGGEADEDDGPGVDFEDGASFDFVIVGGGTAGCVIARRLADENSSWRILVLEAGTDASSLPIVSDPGSFRKIAYSNTLLFNDFVLKSSAKNSPGTPTLLETGRLLGGGSEVNALAYQRGASDTYDEWARITDDPSWSWESLIPFFKKAENTSFAATEPHVRGSGGPLNIETKPLNFFFKKDWPALASSVGFPFREDINGYRNPYGFSTEQFTLSVSSDGSFKRLGTNEGYLQPLLKQQEEEKTEDASGDEDPEQGKKKGNLRVLTSTSAVKLNSKKDDDDASGRKRKVTSVSFWKDGELQKVKVKKEVILSAGALRNPVLLARSGLGKKDMDLGKNLQDHPGLVLVFSHNITDANRVPKNANSIFFNTTSSTATLDGLPLADMLASFQFSAPPSTIMLVKLFLVRNRLQGSVTASEDDLFAPPTVDLDYFSDPDIVIDRFVEAIWQLRSIISNPALSHIDPQEIAPGTQLQSRDELRDWVVDNVYSNNHVAGTCRMGPRRTDDNSDGSVVDSELKMHGVRNLRIADMSIAPVIPSGTPYNAAVLIGEKAAGLLIDDWSQDV